MDADVDHLHRQRVVESPLEPLRPLLQGFGTLFVAGLGLMIGTTVGSLVYPSPPAVGAVGGGVLFFLIFMVIGCLATGFWETLIPAEGTGEKLFSALLPQGIAEDVGGHGGFDVIITIHEMRNVQVNNRLFTRPEYFAEIECDGNPTKATIVKTKGFLDKGPVVFNEQFRVRISPFCTNVIFVIRDQQLFSATAVAWVNVDVKEKILAQTTKEKAFPSMVPLPLQGGSGYTLRHESEKAQLVVSFDPEPGSVAAVARVSDAKQSGVPSFAFPSAQDQITDPTKAMLGQYGSVNFLSSYQFGQLGTMIPRHQGEVHV
eukprot:TRINITY_DN32016_c0_g1_i1.p1 TRINITY_DN32016_c0_g1~~TRINITY_DN32016_c0_g1_i1.p1  ORF type:complete len:316 (+),score=58.95 TRINITY_DN32016_c0_g1_i1:202-1149(+)